MFGHFVTALKVNPDGTVEILAGVLMPQLQSINIRGNQLLLALELIGDQIFENGKINIEER